MAACNLVTGVSDLEAVDKGAPFVDPRGADAMTEGAAPPPRDSGIDPDRASADAPQGDTATCANPATALATTLFGAATTLTPYTVLTPETNALAGGLASAGLLPLTDFDVTFAYSMTYTASSMPAAGVAFFAIGAGAANLDCQAGPYLCPFGAAAPGFGVILRTSKANSMDPPVPYLAVVDAQTYPSVVPSIRKDVDPGKAYSLVAAPNTGVPAASTFHQMAISVRGGKVTASIDGAAMNTGVPIPNWTPGRHSTWGVGAATGLGNAFASRTVVGPVTLTRCP